MFKIKEQFAVCGDCGMEINPSDYHPFAACLMFKQTRNKKYVESNLNSVIEYGKAKNQAEITRLNAIIKENEADNWISVDDKLPDYQSVTQKRLRVLVFWKKTNAVFTLWYGSRFGHTKANFYEENDWDEGSDGLIDENDNLYFGDTLTFKNITHWQPLPQPPAMRVKGE